MKGRIIIHKDGSQSFATDDIEIVKNKENIEDQKEKPANIKKPEKIKFNKGKIKLKSSK